MVIFLMQGYLFIQGMLLSDAPKNVVNSSIIVFTVSTLIYFILRGGVNQDIVLRIFVYVQAILCASVIITIIIFLFYDFDLSQMNIVTRFNTYSRGTDLVPDHIMFLPFTIIWSGAQVGEIALPRFVGMYREPGVAQVFLVTAFFLTYFIKFKYKLFTRSILFIGSLATLSTQAFVSLFAGFIVLLVTNRYVINSFFSKVLIISAASLILYLALFLPTAGIFEKTDSRSGMERLNGYERSIEKLSDHLFFGYGYFSGFKKDNEGFVTSEEYDGILGISFQLGLIGIFLYLLIWYHGLFTSGNLKTLCIYMPCFLTLMISQSFFNDVIVLFLALLDTSKMENVV